MLAALSLAQGRWSDVFGAAWNGLSEFTNELSVGLVVLLFNWVMITRQGVEGVAAYTIIGYLVMIGHVDQLRHLRVAATHHQPQPGRRQARTHPQFLLTGMGAAFLVGLAGRRCCCCCTRAA